MSFLRYIHFHFLPHGKKKEKKNEKKEKEELGSLELKITEMRKIWKKV